MSLTLTTDQTAQLKSLGISGRYADAYDLMKDWTAGATSYDMQLVHTWLLGAADINRGLGPFAALVNAYNQRQGLLRGHEISDAVNHEASDYIAKLIIAKTLETGAIPSFDYIRQADADSRLFLYGDLASSGDTAATQAAAWTGNFLISPFGVDETHRLLSTGNNDSAPDTLDDMKNVLFAYDAFESGLSGLTDTNPSFGSALHAAMAGWGLPEPLRLLPLLTGVGPGWADKVIAGFVAGRVAANAFSQVGAVGQEKFLDMLMGTIQGQCLIGTTTDANFASRAKDFFGSYGATLQTIDAKFLPTDAASLTTLAKTDVNVRAALVALSGVSVTVSATVADKLSLYDAATGQGFTDHWLQDRSAMLSWELKVSKEGAIATESKPYAPDMGLGLTAVPPLYFADVASGEKLYLGGQDRRYFVFGSENDDAIYGRGYSDHLYGGGGNDSINGSGGADYLEGGTGNDTLNGDGDNGEFFSLNGDPGNDTLEGGAGTDTYQFTEAWGKDMVLDADGQGQIQIDGKTVSTAQGAGQRNTWIAKLGTGSGDYASLTVYDDATSSTGKKLVITKAKDSANTITVNNFNLDKATGSEGYLGINLDLTPNVAVVQGGGSNFWSDVEASLSSLAGKTSALTEGVGKTFTVYLNQAAKAGETVTLALSDLADKFKAVLGDSTVAANGAVITLAEGQTQVSFALIQEGEVTADGAGTLSVSYQGEEQSAQSNSWALNLKDGGEITRTYNGDQRTKLIGLETQLNVTPEDPSYNTYAYPWTWNTNGTLTNGLAQTDFADVIYAGSGNDKISGFGGNDALGGGAGNDQIDGGAGDDLIGGGSGSDSINGGDGNDYISSSAGLAAPLRNKPNENWSEFWSVPADTTSPAQSATWGISVDATKSTIWHGIGDTLTVNPGDGDAIDGGAGDDYIIASWGDDRAQGGTGADKIDGLAGADILEGGDGNDTLWGDGIDVPGYLSSVTSASHGADFIDGGAGDDFILGDGQDDQLFGGAGDDVLIGDSANSTDDNYYVSLDFHGADYLDGEDGNDELIGGGKEDTLYGGAGDDNLWGDITADNIAQESDNALMWANDYLDGEDGDDYLEGGGKDDVLYGGLGDDKLFGDEQNIVLKAEFQGQDYLDGEDGNDYLEGGAKDDTLYGGTGNDILWGDSSSANLAGADHGNDYLDGEDGDDSMAGNGGDDTLYGGAGNDMLIGDSNAGDLAIEFQGNDYLDGEEGNDRLNGNGGDDILYGSAGNDQLQGGDGNDQLNGGDDNDTLFGENGNDVLTGGDGTNYFIGGLGNDMLIGGNGNDIYHYNLGDGIDHITDTGGTDWVIFTNISSGQVEIGLGSLKISLPDGGELHLDDFDPENPLEGSIEYFQFSDKVMTRQQLIQTLGFKIKGTQGDDDLTGTALGDTILAFAGNDILAGGAGNDTLQGDEGNDVYLFGAGNGQDIVIDELGNNTISLTGSLTESQISLNKTENDLLISILGTADRLTVKDWFLANSSDWTLALGDGTILDRAAVEERLTKNGAPVLVSDTATAIEDNIIQISGNILENDFDPEGRALQVTNSGTYTGNYGTLTLNNSGDFIYNLNNFSNEIQSLAARKTVIDNFTYTVTDDDPVAAESATSSLIITIQGTNDTPIVDFDFNTTIEDDAVEAIGNVLANDQDIDSGTLLQVTQPGSFQGTYGELTIDIDGSYVYKINNNLASIQSLGRYQTNTETFSYTATDGIENITSSLNINIDGKNDIPTIAIPLIDQSVSSNTAYQWQMPTASFIDIDNGDKLFYSASLTDGSPLPTWLQFDALSATFSGRVPRDVLGYIDIQVHVIDKAMNTNGLWIAGSEGNSGRSSNHDTFRLTFETSKGGGSGSSGGNGGGVGTQGNEGVGNGLDAPPPGHDTNFNDGAGTSPGNPGAQNGNGLGKIRPKTQEISISQISKKVYQPINSPNSAISVNNSVNKFSSNQPEPTTTSSSSIINSVENLPISNISATTSPKDNSAISNNAIPVESAKTGADIIQLPILANPALLDSNKNTPAESKESSASISYIAHWKALDSELATHIATSDMGASISGASSMNSSQNILANSTASTSKNQLSLNDGSGVGLSTFKGLKEGLKKVG